LGNLRLSLRDEEEPENECVWRGVEKLLPLALWSHVPGRDSGPSG